MLIPTKELSDLIFCVLLYSIFFSQLLLTAMIAKNAELKDAKLLADRTENGVLPAEDLVSSGGVIAVVNRTSAVSLSTCASKYTRRHFFTKAESRTPSLLYTFPGSGNTWCRLLIEYGLGIYTGAALYSTYNYLFKKGKLSSWQARLLLRCMRRYEQISLHLTSYATLSCMLRTILLCDLLKVTNNLFLEFWSRVRVQRPGPHGILTWRIYMQQQGGCHQGNQRVEGLRNEIIRLVLWGSDAWQRYFIQDHFI